MWSLPPAIMRSGGRSSLWKFRAVAAVDKDLREQAAERVAHDDRWGRLLSDDCLVVVGDLRDTEVAELLRWVAAQLLNVPLHPLPAPHDYLETLLLIALGPVLPAQGRHPKSVDEDDRVRLRSVCRHISLLTLGPTLVGVGMPSVTGAKRLSCRRKWRGASRARRYATSRRARARSPAVRSQDSTPGAYPWQSRTPQSPDD